MGKTRCSGCGTYHEGSTCPVCAVTEALERDQADRALHAEAMETAQEAAALEQQWAQEAASREHRETTANAWKLQSHAQSERAEQLIAAGLFDDALHHAMEALRLDRSNLKACVLAAATHVHGGRQQEARALYAKAIPLLNVAPYDGSASWHTFVLSRVSQYADLVDLWRDAAVAHITRWSFANRFAAIDAALDLPRTDVAAALVERVTPGMSSATGRVRVAAYLLELARREKRSAADRVRNLLKAVSSTERDEARKAFEAVRDSPGRIGPEAVEALRLAIGARYDEWRAFVLGALREAAVPVVEKPPQSNSGFQIVLALALSAGVALALHFSMNSRTDRPDVSTMMRTLRFVSWAVAAVAAGVALSGFFAARRRADAAATRVAMALEDETRHWKPLLAGTAGSVPRASQIEAPLPSTSWHRPAAIAGVCVVAFIGAVLGTTHTPRSLAADYGQLPACADAGELGIWHRTVTRVGLRPECYSGWINLHTRGYALHQSPQHAVVQYEGGEVTSFAAGIHRRRFRLTGEGMLLVEGANGLVNPGAVDGVWSGMVAAAGQTSYPVQFRIQWPGVSGNPVGTAVYGKPRSCVGSLFNRSVDSDIYMITERIENPSPKCAAQQTRLPLFTSRILRTQVSGPWMFAQWFSNDRLLAEAVLRKAE